MPELPEVETICRGLSNSILNCKITSVRQRRPFSISKKNGFKLVEMVGGNILSVSRSLTVLKNGKKVKASKGKHLFFMLSNGLTLIAHLKMTGAFLTEVKDNDMKHVQVEIELDNGKKTLYFSDIRKFGFLHLVKTSEVSKQDYIAKLGPDALEVSPVEFNKTLQKSSRQIKALLLDQTRIAGLGNIYADELLFACGINPFTPAKAILKQRVVEMHRNMVKLLNYSIKNRGTTISDYKDSEGAAGSFQNKLAIYGRENEKCRKCKSVIRRVVCASRSTFYCPKCQKKKA